MTKSTITREHLQEMLEWCEVFRRHPRLDDIAEAIRMALAAMDSEPVGEFYEDGPLNWYQISDGDRVPAHRRIPLYRHAQPVLVSAPEEVASAIEALKQTLVDCNRYNYCFDAVKCLEDACRAAMLAAVPQSPGSESATVPGKWIPVSEKMPPSRHEVLVGCWWGEKPRWCCKWATYIPGHPDAQSSGWLIPGASWTPTHWMELPAGPQEVNHG